MIEAIDLCKSFGRNRALRDVNFRVAPGEVAGFLGVNGAGKTTTLRILTGFLPPTSGSARIDGKEVHTRNAGSARIGYLPERMPLHEEMRVEGYLRYVAALSGIAPGGTRPAVRRALERSGADVVSGRLIGNVSHGYRRRVGLAQALLGEPSILLLDEPTTGLDPEQTAEFRNLIGGLGGDVTVLLSTHILTEASRTCDKVIILDEGRVLAVDSPERMRSSIAGHARFTVLVVGDVGKITENLRALPGNVRVDPAGGEGGASRFDIELSGGIDAGPEIARAVAEAGGRLFEMKKMRPSLEDVFLRLTGERNGEDKRGDVG